MKNSITIKLSAIGKTANNLVTKSADGIVQIVGVKGAKDGVSYEVCPNYGFVIGSPKDDDSGYNYAPDRIECTVYYTEGTTRRPATDTDLKIRYKVDTSSG